MKACVACGKQLPDGAIVCVFCTARQRSEEELEKTPVTPLPTVISSAARDQVGEPISTAPTMKAASHAGPAPNRDAPKSAPESTLLLRLPAWNRNERACITTAGVAILGWTLLFHGFDAARLAASATLLVAGIFPLDRRLRGLFALVGGGLVLGFTLGPAFAAASLLLPGALLSRAQDPSSSRARLLALAGAIAIVLLYLVPRDGVAPAAAIYSNLMEDVALTNLLRAVYMLLPIALVVVGLLAMLPNRVAGGCLLWATLALLWFPLGLLLASLWQGSLGVRVICDAIALLGSATAASIRIADLTGRSPDSPAVTPRAA